MFNGVTRYLRLSANYYLRGRALVIVYSMERTGSVALYQSLVANGIPAIATHYLDPAKISEGKLSGSARWASKHLIRPRRATKIISLVRNPVDNFLSTFARGEFVDKAVEAGKDLTGIADRSAEDVVAQFQKEFLDGGGYLRPLNWFDAEYKVALGIDAYEHPFDKSRQWGRIKQGAFDCLILRTELDDAAKGAAIAEFLELPAFRMLDRKAATKGAAQGAPGMTAENSAYGSIYGAMKSKMMIPENHWNAIVNSKLARHFIDAGEFGKFQGMTQNATLAN